MWQKTIASTFLYAINSLSVYDLEISATYSIKFIYATLSDNVHILLSLPTKFDTLNRCSPYTNSLLIFIRFNITSHVTRSLNNVLLRCHLPLEKMLDNLNLTKINRNESYAGHHKLITFVLAGLINAADTSPIIIVVRVALLIDVNAPVVYMSPLFYQLKCSNCTTNYSVLWVFNAAVHYAEKLN